MNNKQATIAGLKALGWEVQVGRSRKYRCFKAEGHPHTYLVGKAGALRRTEGAISESVSVTGDRCHRILQEVGRSGLTGEAAESLLEELSP